MDVWSPTPLFSNNNKRYFLCILDDFSRYSWVFSLTCKSNILVMFTKFKQFVEFFFSCFVKSVQSNEGGEFILVQKFYCLH
jgi:hypothetical protein